MSSEAKIIAQNALTWVLYASAGCGAFAYGFFLWTKRQLQKLEVAHGLTGNTIVFNPREVIVRKLHVVEALRGLAIVTMLIGFLYWPVLFIGVLLFFFQTNAWKSTQRDLFALDRDHPEYKLAHQKIVDALGEVESAQRRLLENQGRLWQRVFAMTMGLALIVACSLLFVSANWFSTAVT